MQQEIRSGGRKENAMTHRCHNGFGILANREGMWGQFADRGIDFKKRMELRPII